MMLANLFNLSMLSVMFVSVIFLMNTIFFISTNQCAFIVNWELSMLGPISLEVPFLFDLFSCVFMITVLSITSAVLVFSNSYMSQEKYFLRFHLLVMTFVLSMLLLITSPNLVSILLGWDGLGITSYLLVIYFQSIKSFNAGLLTALTNRVGDVLILFSIALILQTGSWNFQIWSHTLLTEDSVKKSLFLILIAASTKSAQIPFSAWLPAAMAAPTPVSSLVHSSTLVTAGVYLLIRFSEMLMTMEWTQYLLWMGVSTMIMAGMSALYELDMKKIVALSTLSQLGLMMTSIGLGLYEVAFLHLLTHAFFKALLFMSVGNMIHLSKDFQDLRKISLMEFCYPVTLSFAVVANCSLCGLPFMAGFYSKDLILEIILIQNTNLIFIVYMYTAVALTVAYTIRLMVLLMWSSLNISTSLNGEDNDKLMNNSMAILWPLATMSGSGLIWIIFPIPLCLLLPQELKSLALLVILSASVLNLFKTLRLSKVFPNKNSWTWGSMWSLPYISSISINFFSLTASALSRKLDLSWILQVSWLPIFSLNSMAVASLSEAYKKIYVTFIVILLLLALMVFIYLRILNSI